jgi:chromosome segregation ATPase
VQNFDLESLEKNLLETQNKIQETKNSLIPLLEQKNQKQSAFEVLKTDFSQLQAKKEQIFTLQNTFSSQQNTLENTKRSIGEYQNHLQNIASKEEEIQKFV